MASNIRDSPHYGHKQLNSKAKSFMKPLTKHMWKENNGQTCFINFCSTIEQHFTQLLGMPPATPLFSREVHNNLPQLTPKVFDTDQQGQEKDKKAKARMKENADTKRGGQSI